MALKSYAEVQAFIANILIANHEAGGVPLAPHAAFWTLPYNAFVGGSVPGVTNPTDGKPIPILVKGESSQSNLILSLQGKGPLFDPANGAFGQMPANGPPMFSDAQVQEIADWIDAGCPP